MLTLCHQVYLKPVSLVEVVFRETNSLNVCLHQENLTRIDVTKVTQQSNISMY